MNKGVILLGLKIKPKCRRYEKNNLLDICKI